MTKKKKVMKEMKIPMESEIEDTFYTIGIAKRKVEISSGSTVTNLDGFEVKLFKSGIDSNDCKDVVKTYVTSSKAAAIEQFKIWVGKDILLKV